MAVPLAAVRRVAVAAQGYAARSRTGTTSEVEAAVRRLSCVQLDSISMSPAGIRMSSVTGPGVEKLSCLTAAAFHGGAEAADQS